MIFREVDGEISEPYEQLTVDIDRRRAANLGIDLPALAATLRAMIDGDELIDLNIEDEAVPILLESASGKINDPSDLVNLYVTEQEPWALAKRADDPVARERLATVLYVTCESLRAIVTMWPYSVPPSAIIR